MHITDNLTRTTAERIIALSDTYTALMGPYNNASIHSFGNNDRLTIEFPEASLNTNTIYRQQVSALETAKDIKESLYAEGKITASMSEKEIAKIYYDYLAKLGVKPGNIDAANPGGKTVEFDSTYATLVNKTADCVGRAAAF